MDEDKVIKKLEEHDGQFDRVFKKLIEHDDKFDKMLTKQEFVDFKEAHFRGQDKMMVILERLDQERVFTNEAIKRLQVGLEEQKKKTAEYDVEFAKIKKQLQIA